MLSLEEVRAPSPQTPEIFDPGLVQPPAEPATIPSRQPREPQPLLSKKEALERLRQFSQGVLLSEEFERYVYDGLKSGEIPQGVLTSLMHYAVGKPPEKVEIDDRSGRRSLQALTQEELLRKRAEIQDQLIKLKGNGGVH